MSTVGSRNLNFQSTPLALKLCEHFMSRVNGDTERREVSPILISRFTSITLQLKQRRSVEAPPRGCDHPSRFTSITLQLKQSRSVEAPPPAGVRSPPSGGGRSPPLSPHALCGLYLSLISVPNIHTSVAFERSFIAVFY